MSGWLSYVLQTAVLVFSVASMFSVGLSTAPERILRHLRDAGALARALIANFGLTPVLTLGILRLLPLERPLETGLLLLSTAAGAPFLIKLTEAAESRRGMSAALLVFLLPVTVVYMPLVVPRVVPGTTVDARAIAMPLVVAMLLPLAAGLVVHVRWNEWAHRLQPRMQTLSTVALLVFIAATIWRNAAAIAELVSQGTAVLAGFLMIVGAFLVGYGLGGRQRQSCEILGLGTAQRNVAASMVVATQSFASPRVGAMVVVTSLITLATLFPIAFVMRRMRRLRRQSYKATTPHRGQWPR